MVDRLVGVTGLGQSTVGAQLVGVDRAPGFDVFLDKRLERLLADIGNHLRHHVPVALQHPEDDSLVGRVSAAYGLDHASDLRRPHLAVLSRREWLRSSQTTKRELLNKLEKVWDTNLEVLAKQIMNANNPP